MARKSRVTKIGDGSVGLDTTEGVSREIQKSVSENNLKYQIGQNSSVKGVFNATVQMVSRWSDNDKYRILREYGSANTKESPKGDKLNQAVATTLIANMPKEELKRIVGSEESKEIKLTKDVQAANAKSLALRQKLFNAGSAPELMQSHGSQPNNAKQLLKLIKKSDKGFKIDRKIKKDIPRLRKEIITLLKGFTNPDIAKIAVNMDLQFEDNTSFKDLSKSIANEVVLYTALIIGKTKGISASKFTPSSVEEIEKLLMMTDYAWVTGKATVGDVEIGERRKKALKAKKELEENKRKFKESRKYIKYNRKGNVKKKFGLINRRFLKDSATRGAKALNELKDLSDDDLRKLAASRGIAESETLPIDKIKEQLSYIIASESKDISKQTKKALKIKDPVKRKEALDKINNAKRTSIVGQANKMSINAEQDFSDKIPVVTFNQDGKLASEGILKAVPVYVTGTAEKVGKIQSKKEAKMIRDEDLRNANVATDKFFTENMGDLSSGEQGKLLEIAKKLSERDPKFKELYDALENDPQKEKKILKLLSDQTAITKGLTDEQKKHYDAMSVRNVSTPVSATINLPELHLPESRLTSGTTEQALNHRSTREDEKSYINYNRNEGRKNALKRGDGVKISQLKGKVSDVALDIVPNAVLGKKSKDKTQVLPVLDINRSHDYVPEIKDLIELGNTGINRVAAGVDSITQMWGTLQSAGLTVNAASAGGAMALLNMIANGASAVTAETMSGADTHMATGGSARGKNRRNYVSNIITGDHPKNLNNTELVSVDWQNKNINVKPIPKFASGGSASQQAANSNIDNLHRMSQGERNKPLSVGIDSGIIRYSKQLSDVNDDGSGTAIKVYSINSGIHEKIHIGESDVSLFDSVYGIYASLPSIITELTKSNQLLKAISSNTAATNANIGRLENSGGGEGFSFTNELNSILSGD